MGFLLIFNDFCQKLNGLLGNKNILPIVLSKKRFFKNIVDAFKKLQIYLKLLRLLFDYSSNEKKTLVKKLILRQSQEFKK